MLWAVSPATGPLSHQFLAALRPCIKVLGSGGFQKDELGAVESCAWFEGSPSLSISLSGSHRSGHALCHRGEARGPGPFSLCWAQPRKPSTGEGLRVRTRGLKRLLLTLPLQHNVLFWMGDASEDRFTTTGKGTYRLGGAGVTLEEGALRSLSPCWQSPPHTQDRPLARCSTLMDPCSLADSFPSSRVTKPSIIRA